MDSEGHSKEVRLAVESAPVVAGIKDVLTIVGGALGAVAFFWRLWDSAVSYVNLDMEIEEVGNAELNTMTAALTLENSGTTPKRVRYAALLIGPDAAGLAEIARPIAERLGITRSPKTKISDMRYIYGCKQPQPIYDEDGRFALIPIRFFYLEQMQVGNERVKYRCKIDVARLTEGRFYNVFFVVFDVHAFGLLRWRATNELLAAKPRPRGVDGALLDEDDDPRAGQGAS